eukprot:jgi/Chrpa1/16440/Chrysochromulina_OHIO_Genome00005449-RA
MGNRAVVGAHAVVGGAIAVAGRRTRGGGRYRYRRSRGSEGGSTRGLRVIGRQRAPVGDHVAHNAVRRPPCLLLERDRELAEQSRAELARLERRLHADELGVVTKLTNLDAQLGGGQIGDAPLASIRGCAHRIAQLRELVEDRPIGALQQPYPLAKQSLAPLRLCRLVSPRLAAALEVCLPRRLLSP